MTKLHRAAADGFAAQAAAYVAGRPDYPSEIGGWLADDVGAGPGRTVVDLGAGTGKFTTLLRGTDANVIAVEPVDAMRAELTRLDPDIDARRGTAQDIPLSEGAADAVVCAQSFHWFAGPEALGEIRRVLRPRGVLGLVWNIRDESVPWVAALTAILKPYEGDAPRQSSGVWRDLFPGHGFGPLLERSYNHSHSGPPERVIVDRSISVSFIAALPRSEQDKVRERLRGLIADTPELAGKNVVTFPYVTLACRCIRI